MEKRTLLAFVLSLAVLIAWQILFGPSQEVQRPPEKPPETRDAPVSPDVKPSEPRVPLESASPEQLFTEPPKPLEEQFKTWQVESPLFRAQILETGGRMLSLKLKEYREKPEEDSPYLELITTKVGGFLPFALDLMHHPEWDLSTRAFESSAPSVLEVSPKTGKQQLTMQTRIENQLQVTRTFTFSPNNYLIDATVRIKNLSGETLADQLALSFYFEPYETKARETGLNRSQLALFQGQDLQKFTSKELRKERPTFNGPLEWVGYENNYFMQAMLPPENRSYQVVPRLLDEQSELVQMVYLSSPFRIAAGDEKTLDFKVYMGPKEDRQLKVAGSNLERSSDFGFFTFLAKPLLKALNWFYNYLHNYGLAIIALTIVIKIIFWPLTHKSYKSMQGLKKLQPKMQEIREKHKNDRETMNKELMQLYRTYNVNPLGGCLPMVLQIPVFLALYRMLYGAVELYQEPFALWINDLTAPDRLPVGFEIPYLGGLPVLTLLMGVSMFLQQKMTPTPGDPRQQKIMLMLPLVFIVVFVNFPSGLVLYWLTNNVLSIAQQYFINRKAA
jgi:YidC/Oxa1 family membrane protein insertase